MASSRWRALLRLAGLVALVVATAPLHVATKLVRGGSEWPRRFLAAAAWIAGMRVTVDGAPLGPRTLALANHSSWLDILILGGATATAFVSKADVERVPLVGWLADQNHTLYIERADRSDALGQVQRISARLEGDQPLTIFPEGTTSDGRTLLPFRSTLLAAIASKPGVFAVCPVAVDYGEAAGEIAWFGGEAGLANVVRVLGRRGTVVVTVRLLDALDAHQNRKALAREAQARIAAALSSARPRDVL